MVDKFMMRNNSKRRVNGCPKDKKKAASSEYEYETDSGAASTDHASDRFQSYPNQGTSLSQNDRSSSDSDSSA